MIRTIILFISCIIIFSTIQIGNNFYFDEKPDIIMDLEIEQKKANEKFITAQLLSSSLNRVYQIFVQNLTINKKGKSENNDSIDFLNYLTDLLNTLEIKILSIKPKSSEKRGKNLYNPYEINIKSSYEKFGKFITRLEQTTRLIEIEEIRLNNGLERIRSTNRGEQLQTQDYSLIISTISLNKVGGISKNMQKLISNESKSLTNMNMNKKTFNQNNIILDTTLNDTFESMITTIDKDTSFPIYKSNPDSLIINENIQLKNIISALNDELEKTKVSAINGIDKANKQISIENDRLLEEINKFKNSLNTTQINIETQLRESFTIASDENKQLNNIIAALQDELDNLNIEQVIGYNSSDELTKSESSKLMNEIIHITQMLKNTHTEMEIKIEEILATIQNENIQLKNEIKDIQKELNQKKERTHDEKNILDEKANTNNNLTQKDLDVDIGKLKEENIQLHEVISKYQKTLENSQLDIEKRMESFLVTFNLENTLLRDEISELQTELNKSKLELENKSVEEVHEKIISSYNKIDDPKSITVAVEGYYKDQSIASRLRKALVDAGYDARIVEVSLDRKQVFIIYIGYFDDMETAKSHSEKIKKHLGIGTTIKSI